MDAQSKHTAQIPTNKGLTDGQVEQASKTQRRQVCRNNNFSSRARLLSTARDLVSSLAAVGVVLWIHLTNGWQKDVDTVVVVFVVVIAQATVART